MANAKPCLSKIATGDMALKQPQRKAEMVTKLMTEDRLKLHSNKAKCKQNCKILRGTQRHFSENICSEDDLRSRIFGKFFVKFLACLPASPRIFEHLKKWYNCPFLTDFYPKNVT